MTDETAVPAPVWIVCLVLVAATCGWFCELMGPSSQLLWLVPHCFVSAEVPPFHSCLVRNVGYLSYGTLINSMQKVSKSMLSTQVGSK